jgi:hypothetical protein
MLKNLMTAVMICLPVNMAMAAADFGKWEKGSKHVVELRTYHAAPGKLDALLTRFRDHTLKLFEKHGMSSVGYWVPVENKDHLLIFLLAYPDKEARESSWKAFLEDPEWQKAAADSEADGKLVTKADSVFMQPTDFSEGFGALVEGHLIEMRTYTATPGHLPNLHARFRDHTQGLFKKHGMKNLAYFQLTADQPGAEDTLLYFLAHKDMGAATKSWTDFRADPVWLTAKKASEEKAGGSLTTQGGVLSVLLQPTDFSPLK